MILLLSISGSAAVLHQLQSNRHLNIVSNTVSDIVSNIVSEKTGTEYRAKTAGAASCAAAFASALPDAQPTDTSYIEITAAPRLFLEFFFHISPLLFVFHAIRFQLY